MEKLAINSPSRKDSEKPLFDEVYTQITISTFWKATGDDTKKKVQTAAQCEKDSLLSQDTRKRLSPKEKKYLEGSSALELEGLLQSYLYQAKEKQNNVKNSGRKSLRAENKTTRLLNNFHGYVQAYSGVVQIMNAAGPGYGDAAYGALSTFLVVAVNKAKTEELIEGMLLSLQNQYCRIQVVKKVYATDRMKELTAVVYRLGVEFLYEAVRYYSVGTFRRFWHSVAKPPSIELTNKISEIETAVEEIRREMEVLDGIRLNDIEQKIDLLSVDVQRVEEHVQALREIEDDSRVESIRDLLQLDLNLVDTSLREYESDLNQTFEGFKRYPLFDVDAGLFRSRKFNEWRKSDISSLLLLHGSTVAPDQTIFSWLSSGAVRLVSDFEEFFQAKEVTLLRHFCQTSDGWDEREKKATPFTVLSSFIFQILRSDKGKLLLRDENAFAELRHDIGTLNHIEPGRTTERVKKLYSILSSILAKTKPKNIVIVVDRVDRIEGDLYRFLDPLMALIKSTACTLQVFLTLRSLYPFEDQPIKDMLGGRRYFSLVAHQDG